MSCLIYCYAECHYAECRYAECRNAECRYAECGYAECRGVFFSTYSVNVPALTAHIFAAATNRTNNHNKAGACTIKLLRIPNLRIP